MLLKLLGIIVNAVLEQKVAKVNLSINQGRVDAMGSRYVLKNADECFSTYWR